MTFLYDKSNVQSIEIDLTKTQIDFMDALTFTECVFFSFWIDIFGSCQRPLKRWLARRYLAFSEFFNHDLSKTQCKFKQSPRGSLRLYDWQKHETKCYL